MVAFAIKLALLQMRSWERINACESYIVRLLQSLFFARRGKSVHQSIGIFFTEIAISFAPLLAYTVYGSKMVRRLGCAIAVLLALSSVLSRIAPRNHPGHYSSIVAFSGAPLSSFPGARIGCIWVIVYLLIPRNYRLAGLSLAVANQLILGFYFMSDCVIGVVLAQVSVRMSENVTNANLVMLLLLFSVWCWRSSAPLVGALIPVLLAEPLSFNLAAVVTAVLVYFALILIAKELIWPTQGEYELMVSCMLASAATSYILTLFFGKHAGSFWSVLSELKDRIVDGL